ncbi:MAG: DJ-1/PfpI family protein [Mycoplasmoidaceae bacterium]
MSKRVRIGVMVANSSEDIEVIVPTDLWRRSGIIVELISIEKKNSIVLQNGVKISCNHVIDKVNLSQFNALYLPGGAGHLKYLDPKASPKLKNTLLKDFYNKKNKYILAMCASPSVLIEWDLIGERKFTAYPGFGDKLKKYYSSKNVVIDNNLITGKAPGSAYEFALKTIEEFLGLEKRKEIEAQIIY